MIKLARSLDAWDSSDFKVILKRELEQLNPLLLPLQQGLTTRSHALDNHVEVMILNSSEADNCIRAKVGIFYKSIIAGCSCADDPTPVDECNEYCEIQLNIDRSTAETAVILIP